jgi:hypothetical protein
LKNKRQFWQFPWQYKESVVFVAGIVFIGFFLQVTVGAFDFILLQFPRNIILGCMMIASLLLFSLKRKSPLYQWFSGTQMAVTLIGALVVLSIIMGLTPQDQSAHIHDNLFSRFGFTGMRFAWYFVLVYFITLLSLGALIIRRLFSFNKKDYAFYLNHIGLWLMLFAAGIGAADVRRFVMHVREGEIEWRVYNNKGEGLDLPIAIELNDFYMEEYPPQLTVIDRKTGISQPESKPEFFQIDEKQPTGQIAGWDISLKEYIHKAIRNSESTYREIHMPGASPAALVEIHHQQTGIQKQGWVCAGNIAQLYMVLNLDEQYCLAMTRPEPKRFVSDINIYSEDGKREHTLLEVNKPYKMGHWMLYQYGYDSAAGNMSTYSSIELVYDPWIIPVYVGMILLACGSVCLLWTGNKRKRGDPDDVE